MSDSDAMYRNRAKAAHQLQSQQQQAAAAAVSGPEPAEPACEPRTDAPTVQITCRDPFGGGRVLHVVFWPCSEVPHGSMASGVP